MTKSSGEGGYTKSIVENKDAQKEYRIKISVVESVKIFGKTFEVITAQPTLTNSSNNTNDASGLYKSTATNDESPTYYFRGNVKNNYVSFTGFTWRIVRINEDSTIRLVMQGGINNNTETYVFNPTRKGLAYIYYSNSNVESGIKYTLDNWYQTNIVDKNYSNYVAIGDYFCEQVKVRASTTTLNTTGSATGIYYENYTPNFKCETDGNGKGIVNASIGLLTYDEVIHAGGYVDKNNTAYYLYDGTNNKFFTMSPDCINNYDYAYVWNFSTYANVSTSRVSNPGAARPVINIKADTKVTGSGTSTDMFIIQ